VPRSQRYTRSMDIYGAMASNRPMARCNSCNGIITKTDMTCYVCREPIPGRAKVSQFRSWAKYLVAGMLLAGVLAAVAQPLVYGNLGHTILAAMRPR
jgi:hypothetical protein